MGKVLDFTKKREESIEKKRRSFERLLFNNLLGAYSVLDKDGNIYPTILIDISYDGCLFRIPWNKRNDEVFKKGDEKTMRMYFTKDSFIPVVTTIKYSVEYVDTDGTEYMQYGCEFDKSTTSFEALSSFIDFLYKFAEHSTIDKDGKKSFFL